MNHNLPTAPGALLGYRKDGRPFYLLAGGSGEGDGDQGDANNGGNAGDGGAQNDGTNRTGDQSGTGQSGTTRQGDAGGSGEQSGDGRQSGEGGQGSSAAGRVEDLPAWAQAELRRARGDAAKARTAPKDAAEKARNDLAQQIGKALGLVEDDKPADPEKLTEQLTGERSKTRAALVELAVYKNAGRHGANPEALGDSRSFMTAVDKLDPTADDFTDRLGEAIKSAVENNSNLKATGQAPGARTGGEFGAGSGDTSSGDQSVDDLRKERKRWRSGKP